MKTLKYHDGSAWVPVPIVQGPQGAAGTPGVGALLAVQRQWGRMERWQVGHAPNIPIWCNDNGSQVMQLAYTPDVPCWWDVMANIGVIYQTVAAYYYRIITLQLSPADADGLSQSNQYEMQASSVQAYTFSQMQHTFKLNAGVAYTVSAMLSFSGGSWDIYQGPGQLQMEGKVLAQ